MKKSFFEHQIFIFDGDYASWSFDFSNPEFGQKMEEVLVASIVYNPRVMRMLLRLLREAGLQLASVTPHHMAEVGKGNFFMSAIESYGSLPGKLGLLPEDKFSEWINEQQRNHEMGIFFASGIYYTYEAKRE